MTITCPHCGTEAETEAIYCPRCHRNVAQRQPEAMGGGDGPKGGLVRRGELIAIAAIVAFLVIVAVVTYSSRGPIQAVSTSPGEKTQCLSHIKQLATGGMIYLSDYNDHFFPSPSYSKALMPYIKNQDIFSCPTTGDQFAANKQILGLEAVKINDPHLTVFLFEGSGTTPAYVHGSASVAFADSSAKLISKGATLNFKP